MVAVKVPVLLTIKGSQLIHQGRITSITIGKIVSGQPVTIITAFENTGNHHFRVKGEVIVSNPQGKVLDTIHLSLTPRPVIPGLSVGLKAIYTPKTKLAPGVYSVKSRVMLEDGTLLDEASGSFEVEKVYVPPVPAPQPVIPKLVNWWLIGGIIAGVVVVGWLIFFLVRRKRG